MKLLALLFFLIVIFAYFYAKVTLFNTKFGTFINENNHYDTIITSEIESLDLVLHFFIAQILGFVFVYLFLRFQKKTNIIIRAA